MKEYALYRGDEFINIGTIAELAKQENVKYETMRHYLNPSVKKQQMKRKKGGIFLVNVTAKEEDL